MISILVCDRDREERALIGLDCRRRVAARCGEDLSLSGAEDDAALLDAAEQERLVHLLYYEFRSGQALDGLRLFRRRSRDSMVMLVTDAAVSPMEYLRPGVCPDALLLRLLNEENLNAANGEFLDTFLDRLSRAESANCFVVDTREEKIFLSYSQIYYFEARDKKLFARTKDHEYAFYDTIEALGQRLPEHFRRCHRSYIVNMEKVQRYLPAESCVDLGGKIGVPVSRSYRAVFKGVGA